MGLPCKEAKHSKSGEKLSKFNHPKLLQCSLTSLFHNSRSLSLCLALALNGEAKRPTPGTKQKVSTSVFSDGTGTRSEAPWTKELEAVKLRGVIGLRYGKEIHTSICKQIVKVNIYFLKNIDKSKIKEWDLRNEGVQERKISKSLW